MQYIQFLCLMFNAVFVRASKEVHLNNKVATMYHIAKNTLFETNKMYKAFCRDVRTIAESQYNRNCRL